MHKELLLLRHGKSDWNTNSSDFYRTLNNRGQRDAQQMGEWLAEQSLVPDLIICSLATHALTTAEIVSAAMGLSTGAIKTDKSIYEANLGNRQQITHPPCWLFCPCSNHLNRYVAGYGRNQHPASSDTYTSMCFAPLEIV